MIVDSSAFPWWSIALLFAVGIFLWLAFVAALVLALNGLERLVGRHWPSSRKMGLSMVVAAVLLTLLLSLGGTARTWLERAQGERRASQARDQETACALLARPSLQGRPPAVIRAIEIDGAGWGIGKSITNPRQGLPRVSAETLVLHSRLGSESVDVMARNGNTLVFQGRRPMTADLLISYDSAPPAGVRTALPKGAELIANIRIRLRNMRSGEIVAEQNLPTIRFDGTSQATHCWKVNPIDRADYTGPTLTLLKLALEQA